MSRLPLPFGHDLHLQRPPLCPEIALWLIGADVDLEAGCRELHEGEAPPYWAFCWGSGQALARWLLDNPEEASDRRVVDLGTGSGVAAIAAALAGAASVVAVDLDESARRAAIANAAANGLGPMLARGLFRTSAVVPDEWDLLVAGDVLYEPGLAARFDVLCARARAAGKVIIVSEPERPRCAGHAAPVLRRFAVRTLPDVDSPTVAARIHRLA